MRIHLPKMASRPTRDRNPTARLIDPNNSAEAALSSHRQLQVSAQHIPPQRQPSSSSRPKTPPPPTQSLLAPVSSTTSVSNTSATASISQPGPITLSGTLPTPTRWPSPIKKAPNKRPLSRSGSEFEDSSSSESSDEDSDGPANGSDDEIQEIEDPSTSKKKKPKKKQKKRPRLTGIFFLHFEGIRHLIICALIQILLTKMACTPMSMSVISPMWSPQRNLIPVPTSSTFSSPYLVSLAAAKKVEVNV